MGTKSEKAKELFLQGYNCSQAVLGAFCEDINMDFEAAMMISSSFGGGMGRLREVCGAVSAMFMVAGAKYGYASPVDKQAKTEHYRLIQQLAEQFKERNGSIICRELLGIGTQKDSPVPADRTEQYYKTRPCLEKVGEAAELLEALMRERAEEKR